MLLVIRLIPEDFQRFETICRQNHMCTGRELVVDLHISALWGSCKADIDSPGQTFRYAEARPLIRSLRCRNDQQPQEEGNCTAHTIQMLDGRCQHYAKRNNQSHTVDRRLAHTEKPAHTRRHSRQLFWKLLKHFYPLAIYPK